MVPAGQLSGALPLPPHPPAAPRCGARLSLPGRPWRRSRRRSSELPENAANGDQDLVGQLRARLGSRARNRNAADHGSGHRERALPADLGRCRVTEGCLERDRRGGAAVPVAGRLELVAEQRHDRIDRVAEIRGMLDRGRDPPAPLHARGVERRARELVLAAGKVEVQRAARCAALGDDLGQAGRVIALPAQELGGRGDELVPRPLALGRRRW